MTLASLKYNNRDFSSIQIFKGATPRWVSLSIITLYHINIIPTDFKIGCIRYRPILKLIIASNRLPRVQIDYR